MPTAEQPSPEQPQETLEGMPPGDEKREQAEQRFKTLATRVEESLHAQLQFIAQLNGSSISEEMRRAIEHRIATAQDDPELVARAQAARTEIEREAAARAAAIAGFLGAPAVAESPAQSNSRPRRTGKAASE